MGARKSDDQLSPAYFLRMRKPKVDRRARSDELTPLQLEILERLADGAAPKEIRFPHRAPGTTRGQIWLLRQKLAAKTCAHAVAIALRRGLIK